MQPIEIIVIVACVVVVVAVIANGIIKKKKGISSCGCDCANCPSKCGAKNKTKKQ